MLSPLKIAFETDEIYLPVNMVQFETLTNEILVKVNEHASPNALDADYMAQILMSAIHALDHKQGVVTKTSLLDSCINRISCHITYHASQEIQKRLQAKNDEEKEGLELVKDEATEPQPV